MRVTQFVLACVLACSAIDAQDTRLTAITGVTIIDGQGKFVIRGLADVTNLLLARAVSRQRDPPQE